MKRWLPLAALVVVGCSHAPLADPKDSPAFRAFAATPDFCVGLPPAARQEIEHGARELVGTSGVGARYRLRLVQESCKLVALKARSAPTDPLCRELRTELSSACFLRAAAGLSGRDPFSYSGVTLFLAMETQFTMDERMADHDSDAKDRSERASRGLIAGLEEARTMLLHRARPADWIGVRVPELERKDREMSRDLCGRISDLGLRAVGTLRNSETKGSAADRELDGVRDRFAQLGECAAL